MKKILALVFGMLLSQGAFAAGWGFASIDAKGSYHIKITKNGSPHFSATSSLSKNSTGNYLSDVVFVSLLADGAAATVTTTQGGVQNSVVHVDAGDDIVVTVSISGKLSGYGNSSGSGSSRWEYTGTGSGPYTLSKQEYGLASVPDVNGSLCGTAGFATACTNLTDSSAAELGLENICNQSCGI